MSLKRLTCLLSVFAGLSLCAAPVSAQEWWNPVGWFSPQRTYVARPTYGNCPNGNCYAAPATYGYQRGYVVNRASAPATYGTSACPGGNCAGKCNGNCTTGNCANGRCGATAMPYRPTSNRPVSGNLQLVPTSGQGRTRPSPFYE